MKEHITRRNLLHVSAVALTGGLVDTSVFAQNNTSNKNPLRLGLVTYNLAKTWDVDTIIKNCSETGFEAVELRTTHAHKVEVGLTKQQRVEIRKRFEDSPVDLASLGSAFEFDSPDPVKLQENIEGTKEYVILAHDVGAEGVKVRPNNLHVSEGVPEDKTLEQIGVSLSSVGSFAQDYGVEIRVEVHGRETSRIPRMKKIFDYANNGNCFACWNSNDNDMLDGGFEENFNLLKDKIHFVHMRDLFLENYPFRRLFERLKEESYTGYCCAEIPASEDPVRVMKYYRALFLAYQNVL